MPLVYHTQYTTGGVNWKGLATLWGCAGHQFLLGPVIFSLCLLLLSLLLLLLIIILIKLANFLLYFVLIIKLFLSQSTKSLPFFIFLQFPYLLGLGAVGGREELSDT